MLKSEKFLDILLRANQTFPKITGQLFTYKVENQRVQLLNKNTGDRNSFKFRWLLMIYFACSTLARIVFVQMRAKESNAMATIESNLCAMTFCMLLVGIECYRMWAYHPEDFILFLNGAIDMELIYAKGSIKL